MDLDSSSPRLDVGPTVWAWGSSFPIALVAGVWVPRVLLRFPAANSLARGPTKSRLNADLIVPSLPLPLASSSPPSSFASLTQPSRSAA